MAFLMLTGANNKSRALVNFDTVEEIAIVSVSENETECLLRFASGKKTQVAESIDTIIAMLGRTGESCAW